MVLFADMADLNKKDKDGLPVKPPSKVRVTFFESEKPVIVTSPDLPDGVFLDLPMMSTPSPTHDGSGYIRHESREHEFDNPFRPDSDLSREAEHIVRMIKAGKPITTPVEDGEPRVPSPEPINSNHTSPVREHLATANNVYPNKSSPGSGSPTTGGKVGSNGTATPNTGGVTVVDPVEIQHGVVVPPSDASQVERVVVKKKPKSKCCVVM